MQGGKKVGLNNGGSIIVGDKGILYSPTRRRQGVGTAARRRLPRLQGPAANACPQPARRQQQTMDEGQKVEWLAAIKGGPCAAQQLRLRRHARGVHPAGQRRHPRTAAQKLEWDGPNLKFPNAPAAEKWLKRQYREPWSL